jgi:hypothetical protein
MKFSLPDNSENWEKLMSYIFHQLFLARAEAQFSYTALQTLTEAIQTTDPTQEDILKMLKALDKTKNEAVATMYNLHVDAFQDHFADFDVDLSDWLKQELD